MHICIQSMFFILKNKDGCPCCDSAFFSFPQLLLMCFLPPVFHVFSDTPTLTSPSYTLPYLLILPSNLVLTPCLPHLVFNTEKRQAVVEVGKPWANVIVQRKLPPLKYFYDFEMSKSPSQCMYVVCTNACMYQCMYVPCTLLFGAYSECSYFDTASSVWDMAYGPCLEPGMAQASGSFGKGVS